MQIIYAISVGRLHKEKKQTNINFTYSCYWIWQRATDIIVGYGNVPAINEKTVQCIQGQPFNIKRSFGS